MNAGTRGRDQRLGVTLSIGLVRFTMNPGITRQEIVRTLVMGSCADDWEDFEMITHETHTVGRRAGLDIAAQEIHDALVQLVSKGLADAGRLSPSAPAQALSLAELSECYADWDTYYYLTPAGQQALAEIKKHPHFDFLGTVWDPPPSP